MFEGGVLGDEPGQASCGDLESDDTYSNRELTAPTTLRDSTDADASLNVRGVYLAWLLSVLAHNRKLVWSVHPYDEDFSHFLGLFTNNEDRLRRSMTTIRQMHRDGQVGPFGG